VLAVLEQSRARLQTLDDRTHLVALVETDEHKAHVVELAAFAPVILQSCGTMPRCICA
jgi:hypothetical protein